MPYSTRTRDRILRRPIAAQNTIPDQDIWYQKGLDAEQARQDAEDYNWYLLNRGMMQPDGSYFGPELRPHPQLDYDPSVRQVGQPMRQIEYVDQPSRNMEAFSDLLFGYDPREVAEDYEPDDGMVPAEALALGLVPGPVGRVANKVIGPAFAGEVAYETARGRQPGALDMMFMGGLATHAASRANRARRAFQQGYKQGRARKMAEQARRARALDAPRVRMQNARTGRWDEVNAYPEFVPYEEVRF